MQVWSNITGAWFGRAPCDECSEGKQIGLGSKVNHNFGSWPGCYGYCNDAGLYSIPGRGLRPSICVDAPGSIGCLSGSLWSLVNSIQLSYLGYLAGSGTSDRASL